MLLGGKSYAFAEHQQYFLTLTDFTLERERYCLPDSRFVLVYKSRDFVPGYSRFARYCLPDRPPDNSIIKQLNSQTTKQPDN